MSYSATVCKLTNVRKFPNADRLQLANVLGYQVVVGLNNFEGEIGVFFPPDGILSEKMCETNDLIGRKDPTTGEKKGGYFSENRRVRAQIFRGQRSEGFWIPLSAFTWTGVDVSTLKDGYEFSHLGDNEVCTKYYTPSTREFRQKHQRETIRSETKYFRKHPKTPQFRNTLTSIPPGSVIWLSEKIHGTSHRVGRVLEKTKLSWWKRMVNRFVPAFPLKEYALLHGSMNIILRESFRDFDDFRYRAVGYVALHKNECLYGEVAGFISPAESIHPSCVPDTKDLKKKYGDRINFYYGCKPGEVKFFVYRIVRSDEDGNPTELSWLQVVQRCKELGLSTVPLIGGAYLYDGNQEELSRIVTEATEGSSLVDPSQIREGVVLRVESDGGIFFIKNKSFDFLRIEGVIKDDPDYIDLEEVS